MAVEFKDYYRVLGVTPKATDEEIKKAFRSLARKTEPGIFKGYHYLVIGRGLAGTFGSKQANYFEFFTAYTNHFA